MLAHNINGYGNLAEFITRMRRATERGTYVQSGKTAGFPGFDGSGG